VYVALLAQASPRAVRRVALLDVAPSLDFRTVEAASFVGLLSYFPVLVLAYALGRPAGSWLARALLR
jgi:hypothetical protein